jgi:hypothetical protein
MLSAVALLVDALSGGLSGALVSFSVGLITVGVMVDRFGFVVDGVEAKDLNTWAANSARVAGRGRPEPMARCSWVEAVVVAGAGSMGGWDWSVGVAEGCGALFCVGTGLCGDTDFLASASFLPSMRFWGGAGAAGGDV